MQEDLLTFLLANGGIAALCADRIAWVTRPRGSALPAVVLHLISGRPDYHHQGASGLAESRVQADCYATTYLASLTLARALEAAVSGYRGTVGTTKFQPITIASVRSDYGDTDPDEIFLTSLDLMVWHSIP